MSCNYSYEIPEVFEVRPDYTHTPSYLDTCLNLFLEKLRKAANADNLYDNYEVNSRKYAISIKFSGGMLYSVQTDISYQSNTTRYFVRYDFVCMAIESGVSGYWSRFKECGTEKELADFVEQLSL